MIRAGYLLIALVLFLTTFVAQSQQSSSVTALDWTADGTLLAVAFRDGHVEIWDYTQPTPSLAQSFQITADNEVISAVAWHPTSNTDLAISSLNGQVAILDTGTGYLTIIPGTVSEPARNRATYDVVWDPAGLWLAFSIQTNSGPLAGYEIRVWDVSNFENLQEVYKLVGHSFFVASLAWHPTQNWLASGGSDQTAIVWDMATGQPLAILEGHDSPIRAVAWSRRGDMLITGAREVYEDFEPLDPSTLKTWDATNDWAQQSLPYTETISSFDINPVDDTLAIVFVPDPITGDRVQIVNSTDGRVITTVDNTAFAETVSWQPSGAELAYGDRTGAFEVINTEQPACTTTIPSGDMAALISASESANSAAAAWWR